VKTGWVFSRPFGVAFRVAADRHFAAWTPLQLLRLNRRDAPGTEGGFDAVSIKNPECRAERCVANRGAFQDQRAEGVRVPGRRVYSSEIATSCVGAETPAS